MLCETYVRRGLFKFQSSEIGTLSSCTLSVRTFLQHFMTQLTKTSVTALTQLVVMRMFGEAVHRIGGGGTICHL